MEQPWMDEESRPFWEAARRHQLVVHRCRGCGRSYFPASHCPSCPDSEMEWVAASGRGQVFAFVVYHQAYHPDFQGRLPYNVAYIELEEGPLLLSTVVGCPQEQIRVGMPVAVVFEDVTPDLTLPKFKPVS